MHGNRVSDVWPQICISSSQEGELLHASSRAQWVEWRVDLLGEEPSAQLDRSKLLWTWRTPEPRSLEPRSLELRSTLARTQALIKALYLYGLVDMQLETDGALVRSLRPLLAQKVILSYHGVFSGIDELAQTLSLLRAYPHVYRWKIALDYSQSTLEEVVRSLAYLNALDLKWREKLIFIPMGERLAPWRIIACQQLADFLFCAPSIQSATAKGQLPIEHILALQDGERSTCFMGLIGNPVKQSISHLSHNRLLRQLHCSGSYLKFPLQEQELAPLLRAAHTAGFKGFSVTVPYKPEALQLAASSSPRAQLAQAANTLSWKPEGWHADNTDMRAFEDIFEEIGLNEKTRVLVIGAGGSCRAVLAAAAAFRPRLFLTNRTLERAELLTQEFGVEVVASTALTREFLQRVDLLIQTSTLGMAATPSIDKSGQESSSYPFTLEDLNPATCIIELVNGASTDLGDAQKFGPTPLVRYARKQGNRVFDAELFFFKQAAYQFEAWLDQSADSLLQLLQRDNG